MRRTTATTTSRVPFQHIDAADAAENATTRDIATHPVWQELVRGTSRAHFTPRFYDSRCLGGIVLSSYVLQETGATI